MTKRYFIHLAYNGGAYCGWQIQPNGETVQGVLENALSVVLRTSIEIVGAGRTDAGVHAKSMIAHFDAEIELPTDLPEKLNRFLPPDIVIHEIEEVAADAHSRFDAESRLYRYYVTNVKDPFAHQLKHRIPYLLDVDKMNEAANCLFDYIDFTSFSKIHTDVKTNNCIIMLAKWEQNKSEYVFTIKANRFLRNMVRSIVGTLIDVGRGKITVTDFRAIIEAKDRSKASTSAPGHALFLEEVIYNNNKIKNINR